MRISPAEMDRRLRREDWLLKSTDDLMEVGPAVTRCKLCERVVERGDEQAHWERHVEQRKELVTARPDTGLLRCVECGHVTPKFRGWTFTAGRCSGTATGRDSMLHKWRAVKATDEGDDA